MARDESGLSNDMIYGGNVAIDGVTLAFLYYFDSSE